MSEFNAYDNESLQEVLQKASEGDRIKFMPDNQEGSALFNVVIDENGNKTVEEVGDYLDVLNDETPYVQDERVVYDEMKESPVEDLPSSTPMTYSASADEKSPFAQLESEPETPESPIINMSNIPELSSKSTSSTLSPLLDMDMNMNEMSRKRKRKHHNKKSKKRRRRHVTNRKFKIPSKFRSRRRSRR